MRNIETFPSKHRCPYLSYLSREKKQSSIIIQIEGANQFDLNDLFSSLFPDNSWCPYHLFVQKSAQYRHKILNVCVKVCIKTRPASHKESPWFVALNRRKNGLSTILVCYFLHVRSSVCPDMNDRKLKQGKQTFSFCIFYWNQCPQSSDSWHLCLPSIEMLSGEHGRELVWFGPD